MKRRFFKSLTLWIVPLLIVRAMIPAGFMLSAGADGFGLVFCSSGQLSAITAAQAPEHGQAGHPGASQHASQHSGHPQQHQEHDAGSGHENSLCPFALAASVVPTDVQQHASTAVSPSDETFDFLSAPTFRVGPLRADRIRGPPSLS